MQRRGDLGRAILRAENHMSKEVRIGVGHFLSPLRGLVEYYFNSPPTAYAMGYDLSPALRATTRGRYPGTWLHEAHQLHGNGALTFSWYNVGPEVPEGHIRKLIPEGQFTTTIDQVALAFTAPANLPPAGVYQDAIQSELEKLRNAHG